MARRVLRLTLVIVVVGAVMGFASVYEYNPLGTSLQSSQGQFSSNVMNADGSAADVNGNGSISLSDPLGGVTYIEPTGTFRTEIQTEITNNGSRTVHFDNVGKPDVSNETGDYRVSFYTQGSTSTNAGAPFRPFILAAHTSRSIVVDFSQRCVTSSAAGMTIQGVSGIPVTFTLFGFAHTNDISVIPYAIETVETS